MVRTLDAHARMGVRPWLTVLLDCAVDEGLARARGRRGPGDRFEQEVRAFHERVRDGFLALAAAEPTRFCVVDSAAPLAEVRDRVVAAVERRLRDAA
jgi:dTMP kinase